MSIHEYAPVHPNSLQIAWNMIEEWSESAWIELPIEKENASLVSVQLPIDYGVLHSISELIRYLLVIVSVRFSYEILRY